MNILNERLEHLNATEAKIVRSIEGAQKRLRELQDEKKKVLKEMNVEYYGDEKDE